MKKLILMALGFATVAGLFIVGVTFAQGENPPFGLSSGDGTSNLHEYMEKAMADALGLSLKEFEAKHDAGETFYDMAISKGFAADEIPALMQGARKAALNAAAAEGVISPEQAEWMNSRGYGRGFMGKGPGTQNEECPMYGDGTNFEHHSPGMMSGSRGGGRWQTQNR